MILAQRFALVITGDAQNACGERVRKVIEEHGAALLPPWCLKLTVDFEPAANPDAEFGAAGGSTAAYMRCHPEYRLADLTVGGSALTYEDDLFEETIIHELGLRLHPRVFAGRQGPGRASGAAPGRRGGINSRFSAFKNSTSGPGFAFGAP